MNGKAGKEQLSPNMMDALKKAVFSQFPFEVWENEKHVWADCVRAIDKAGRKVKKED